MAGFPHHPETGPVEVELRLVAGSAVRAATRVEVLSAVAVNTADPAWAGRLVDTIAAQALQGARHLVAEMHPGHTAVLEAPFVPLAAIAPLVPPRAR